MRSPIMKIRYRVARLSRRLHPKEDAKPVSVRCPQRGRSWPADADEGIPDCRLAGWLTSRSDEFDLAGCKEDEFHAAYETLPPSRRCSIRDQGNAVAVPDEFIQPIRQL